MSETLEQLRRNRKFLSMEQIASLQYILTSGCKKEIQLRMGEILRNTFYSLEDRSYWKRFIVVDERGFLYKELQSGGHRSEIKIIREDILGQRRT